MNFLFTNVMLGSTRRLWEVFVELGEVHMLKTITIGNYLSVQGFLVRMLDNGRMVVRVDNKVYEGKPVAPAVTASA